MKLQNLTSKSLTLVSLSAALYFSLGATECTEAQKKAIIESEFKGSLAAAGPEKLSGGASLLAEKLGGSCGLDAGKQGSANLTKFFDALGKGGDKVQGNAQCVTPGTDPKKDLGNYLQLAPEMGLVLHSMNGDLSWGKTAGERATQGMCKMARASAYNAMLGKYIDSVGWDLDTAKTLDSKTPSCKPYNNFRAKVIKDFEGSKPKTSAGAWWDSPDLSKNLVNSVMGIKYKSDKPADFGGAFKATPQLLSAINQIIDLRDESKRYSSKVDADEKKLALINDRILSILSANPALVVGDPTKSAKEGKIDKLYLDENMPPIIQKVISKRFDIQNKGAWAPGADMDMMQSIVEEELPKNKAILAGKMAEATEKLCNSDLETTSCDQLLGSPEIRDHMFEGMRSMTAALVDTRDLSPAEKVDIDTTIGCMLGTTEHAKSLYDKWVPTGESVAIGACIGAGGAATAAAGFYSGGALAAPLAKGTAFACAGVFTAYAWKDLQHKYDTAAWKSLCYQAGVTIQDCNPSKIGEAYNDIFWSKVNLGASVFFLGLEGKGMAKALNGESRKAIQSAMAEHSFEKQMAQVEKQSALFDRFNGMKLGSSVKASDVVYQKGSKLQPKELEELMAKLAKGELNKAEATKLFSHIAELDGEAMIAKAFKSKYGTASLSGAKGGNWRKVGLNNKTPLFDIKSAEEIALAYDVMSDPKRLAKLSQSEVAQLVETLEVAQTLEERLGLEGYQLDPKTFEKESAKLKKALLDLSKAKDSKAFAKAQNDFKSAFADMRTAANDFKSGKKDLAAVHIGESHGDVIPVDIMPAKNGKNPVKINMVEERLKTNPNFQMKRTTEPGLFGGPKRECVEVKGCTKEVYRICIPVLAPAG